MKNPITIYIPYCYLIGWSKLNKFYYGVRTAKNCNPSDFWVKYFTSSKQVKKFRKKYGDPDIIQIRKTFLDKDSAMKWESKVLRRLNVKDRNDFLNLCNSYPDFCTNGYVPVVNIKTGDIEMVTCEEYINGKNVLYESCHKGKNFSDKTKNKLSIAKKGTILIHNLEKCLRIFPNELEHYIQLGYEMGMLPETKIKMNGYKKGNKPHNYGKIWIVNKNNEMKSISPNEFEIYSKNGFIKGRKYI